MAATTLAQDQNTLPATPKPRVSSPDNNEKPSSNPRFSMPEIVIGILICIVFDIVGGILEIFFDVGAVLKIVDWLIFTFWFTIKGCSVTAGLVKRFLIPIAVDLIPFVPTLTICFAVSVYMENHPEKFGVLEKVESVAKKVPLKK